MRIAINLNPDGAQIAADVLECQLASPKQADWLIVFYTTSAGGTDNPDMITKPEQTTVIAGPYTESSLAFALAAKNRGVSAENIFFIPPGPLEPKRFQAIIGQTVKTPKPLKICFVSEKGGTGKTTLAAALTNHYQHYENDAVLLDLCPIPNTPYHLSEAVFISNLDALASYQNQRVIIDTPTGFRIPDEGLFDVVIGVVDPDVIQCLRPTCKEWPQLDLVILNRCKNTVQTDLAKQIFKCPVISIEEDYPGCYAALAGHQTANTKSEAVDKAIGQLVRFIEGRNNNHAANVYCRVR